MATPVWIGLGSNCGDRRATLADAVLALRDTPGIIVATVSADRETRPVGGPPGQGAFLNAAARIETSLPPRALLARTQEIERDLGRVRGVRWGERTLDLDILVYGTEFVDDPDLKLPHPRMPVRRFVLEPLAEIAPDLVDAITRRTMSDLLRGLDRSPRLLVVEPSLARRLAGLMDSLARSLAAPLVSREMSGLGPAGGRPPATIEERPRVFDPARLITEALAEQGPGYRGWVVADLATDDLPLGEPGDDDPSRTDRLPEDREVAERPGRRPARRADAIPDPTLIVAGPTSPLARRPGVGHWPIYWPEATGPEAIVAEVVAICRGIEGR